MGIKTPDEVGPAEIITPSSLVSGLLEMSTLFSAGKMTQVDFFRYIGTSSLFKEHIMESVAPPTGGVLTKEMDGAILAVHQCHGSN